MKSNVRFNNLDIAAGVRDDAVASVGENGGFSFNPLKVFTASFINAINEWLKGQSDGEATLRAERDEIIAIQFQIFRYSQQNKWGYNNPHAFDVGNNPFGMVSTHGGPEDGSFLIDFTIETRMGDHNFRFHGTTFDAFHVKSIGVFGLEVLTHAGTLDAPERINEADFNLFRVETNQIMVSTTQNASQGFSPRAGALAVLAPKPIEDLRDSIEEGDDDQTSLQQRRNATINWINRNMVQVDQGLFSTDTIQLGSIDKKERVRTPAADVREGLSDYFKNSEGFSRPGTLHINEELGLKIWAEFRGQRTTSNLKTAWIHVDKWDLDRGESFITVSVPVAVDVDDEIVTFTTNVEYTAIVEARYGDFHHKFRYKR